MVGAVGCAPSVIVQLVEPAGMLTVVEPVVAFAATFTVPVYVAVGVEHATLNGNAIALVVAGPPVMFFVTVSVPGLALSGLVMLPLDPVVIVPLGGDVVSVPQV